VLPSIRKNGSYNIINNYIEEDLDKYYKKDCVYIIHIIDKIYKYGYSSNIAKRLQNHKNILNYTKIIKIYEMKNINQIIELEKKIKKFVHSLDITPNSLNFGTLFYKKKENSINLI
jgi:predicted GIY-YIG superfamily endonuclease